jgi:UMP-CMP kinase
MAATASGRQAWRQLMRNTTCRGHASSLLRQQQHTQAAFRRLASSSSTTASSRRAVTQSPSTFLRQQPLAQRSYSSGSQGRNTPPKNNSQVKFWPFLIVIAFGFGGYAVLVNQRKGELPYP